MNEFDENKIDLEEDTVLSGEEETAEKVSEEIAEETVSQDDAVKQEMEDLRDLFQQELDKTTAETYLSGGDLQDVDDTEEEDDEEEIDEDDLCLCCGEKKRDTSFGEDYPYCADCRRIMQKYPIGFKGVFMLLVVIAMGIVSLFFTMPKDPVVVTKTIDGDAALAEKKLYSALYNYYDAIQAAAGSSKVMPKKTVAKCADIFAQMNDYPDAASFVKNYLTETDLKNPMYSRLNEFIHRADTITAVQQVLSDTIGYSGSETDMTEVAERLDALKADEEKNYDPYFIDYYKCVAMHNLKEPIEDQIRELEKLNELYPDEWIQNYDLCAAVARTGNVEEAQKAFDIIMAHNAQEATAYAYLADAYRYGDKPDPDKILELADKGFEAQGDYNYASCDLYRTQAIAYLLKGDYDKAYESASQMYQIAYSYSFNVNNVFQTIYTYALACAASGNDEGYSEAEGILNSAGYDMAPEIKMFESGKMTIEEILTDKDGELA